MCSKKTQFKETMSQISNLLDKACDTLPEQYQAFAKSNWYNIIKQNVESATICSMSMTLEKWALDEEQRKEKEASSDSDVALVLQKLRSLIKQQLNGYNGIDVLYEFDHDGRMFTFSWDRTQIIDKEKLLVLFLAAKRIVGTKFDVLYDDDPWSTNDGINDGVFRIWVPIWN